jgi:hypothetical protein
VQVERALGIGGAHREARAVDRDEALRENVLHPLGRHGHAQIEATALAIDRSDATRAGDVASHFVSTQLVTDAVASLDTHDATDLERAERAALERLRDDLEQHARTVEPGHRETHAVEGDARAELEPLAQRATEVDDDIHVTLEGALLHDLARAPRNSRKHSGFDRASGQRWQAGAAGPPPSLRLGPTDLALQM